MPAALIAALDDLDLEAMKALIRAQHEQLNSRASEIAHLKLLLDKLQRMLFGARSEKLVRQVAQLELQLEELETSLCRSMNLSNRSRGLPVVRCPNICRVRSRRIVPRQPAALVVEVHCASLEKMSPKCSSMCLRASR
jgi:hypothetical protein